MGILFVGFPNPTVATRTLRLPISPPLDKAGENVPVQVHSLTSNSKQILDRETTQIPVAAVTDNEICHELINLRRRHLLRRRD